MMTSRACNRFQIFLYPLTVSREAILKAKGSSSYKYLFELRHHHMMIHSNLSFDQS